MNIISSNNAGRLIGGKVVRYASPHDDDFSGHQRRGGLLIIARFDFAHAAAEIDGTAIAKGVAQFPRVGIKGDESGVNRGQEQTTRTDRGWATRACCCRSGVILVVTQAPAALPVRRGGLRIETPFFFPAIDI